MVLSRRKHSDTVTDRPTYDPERVIDTLATRLAAALAQNARLEAVVDALQRDAGVADDDEESTP